MVQRLRFASLCSLVAAVSVSGCVNELEDQSLALPEGVADSDVSDSEQQALNATLTFTAVADAYTASDVPGSNFGSTSLVQTDASPVNNAYFRFTPANLPGGLVSSAKLSLYAGSGSSIARTVRRASGTWGETTITFNNAPAATGAAIATFVTVPAAYTDIDITPYVKSLCDNQASCTVGIVVTTTGSTRVSFSSRTTTHPPVLTVSAESGTPVGSGCVPTNSCTAQSCGLVSDGCGGTLDCGGCTSPASCGGGGVANVCGTSPTSGTSHVIVAGGDIAGSWSQDEATAKVIDAIAPEALLTLGDTAYDSGSLSQFTTYYDPTWGRHQDVTQPVPGNHDHAAANLSGYCTYFGAGGHCQNGQSYYSYDIGTWHFIALDSGCSSPSSCSDPMAAGTAMRQFLTADLAAHPNRCTIAYWHHPRFSSGSHGNNTRSSAIWTELYNAGVDIVLNGHDHNYERFSPQTPSGAADAARGITEFVVGTGGAGLRSLGTRKANSAVATAATHGVLKLTLKDGSADFVFKPIAGQTFTDQGTVVCH